MVPNGDFTCDRNRSQGWLKAGSFLKDWWTVRRSIMLVSLTHSVHPDRVFAVISTSWVPALEP
jgi:hypothetical protein